MPVEGNQPNPLRADEKTVVPDDTRDGGSVALGGDATGGTVRQESPPSWVERGALAPPGSDASRSGREVYELEREIEYSRAAGGADMAAGYTLVRKLGTGSFGAVWEAENRLTRERVAVKFFTAGDADWAKLLGEVGLLQTVEGCRGIVLVKEVRQGAQGCRPHYVMQLANSGSVADWVKSAGGLAPRERARAAVAIFTQAAHAMAAVHRRGIHHCDLKPHNILLHAPEEGAPPEPLVADFGQAHLATDNTPALGTFFYMPPDQIDAAQSRAPPDARWDVYALGAVAYEMLTGEPPRRTPELVERIKKSPRTLQARMGVYREGIAAAPKPDAHRRLCDPMLAKIIDRCINLRPERRPADAGALLALLNARARWRRTRPILGLAAAATVLLVALVSGLGLLAADVVTERTKENVTADVTGSLARTAGFGTRAVEDRLQRYVVSLERWADKAHDDHPEAVAALRGAAVEPRGPKLSGDHQINGHDRVKDWLGAIHKERVKRASDGEHLPTLGVMFVADDAAGGPPQSRGFYLARVQQDGKADDAANAKTAKDREFFTDDFSYRDYFHSGPGESDRVGSPHPVVRHSHISHPFRSRGVDHTGEGDTGLEHQRWKLNVVAPVWGDPARRGRVIGLLVLGLDVEYDIKPLLYPMNFERPAGAGHGYGIGEQVKVVVADHRGRWVWHPDCAAVLDHDSAEFRHPHAYPELARRHGLADGQAGPWLSLGDPPPDAGRSYGESSQYVDALEAELDGGAGAEIACFTRFAPFERSQYAKPNAPGGPAPPRRWVFVAQVDKKAALRPLDEMRGQVVRGGVAVVGALSLIAAGLWVGLVVVLRRLEFASHG